MSTEKLVIIVTAPSFDILNKNMLKYKAIDIQFSNFIINNPENNILIKLLFNIITSISTYQEGKELVHLITKLLIYLKENVSPPKKCRHT